MQIQFPLIRVVIRTRAAVDKESPVECAKGNPGPGTWFVARSVDGRDASPAHFEEQVHFFVCNLAESNEYLVILVERYLVLLVMFEYLEFAVVDDAI